MRLKLTIAYDGRPFLGWQTQPGVRTIEEELLKVLRMLLRDTSFQLAGISVVHGVDYAEKITERLLAWYAPQRSIAVHRGAKSYKEFGQRNAAVNAIEKALEAGPLIILALGPATKSSDPPWSGSHAAPTRWRWRAALRGARIRGRAGAPAGPARRGPGCPRAIR